MSLGSEDGKRKEEERKERKKEGKERKKGRERNRMILFNTLLKKTELTCWSLETLIS